MHVTLVFIVYFSLMQSLTKIGLSISASFYYQLEPVASLHICPTPKTCGPALKVCAELYQNFPASHIDIFAWYQKRYLKWCKWGWIVSNQLQLCVHLSVCHYAITISIRGVGRIFIMRASYIKKHKRGSRPSPPKKLKLSFQFCAISSVSGSCMNTVYMWLVLNQPCGHFGPTLQLASYMNNNEIHLTLGKRGGN